MTTPTPYEVFESTAHQRGFDTVLVREWKPDLVVAEHTHPFDVEARVVRGEFWLTVGAQVQHLGEGASFSLARDVPHSERYGAAGTTVWVARRQTAA